MFALHSDTDLEQPFHLQYFVNAEKYAVYLVDICRMK